MPRIPVGIDDFSKIVKGGYLFVDHSLMIPDLVSRGEEVTLLTRGRRWGKSFNMSMFHYFLSPIVNGQQTQGLFDNLKVSNNKEFMAEHQGKYPVISITFKDVNEPTFAEAVKKIAILIRQLFLQYPELETSTKLSQAEKNMYASFTTGDVDTQMLEQSILILSQLLYRHYNNKQVYILIDEYDAPLNSAYSNQYLSQITSFMRNLFSAALKSNLALQQGVMTGVLRVSKDSMLSGLNNLKTYTLLDDRYKQYFGFTEEEVVSLFAKQELEAKIESVRSWYNGYQSGDLVVYNPWSIMCCLSEGGKLEAHWVNAGRNDLIKEIIIKSSATIKSELEELIKGNSISVLIDKHVTFDRLHEGSALWSILLFTGYLMAQTAEYNENINRYQCQVRIPNKEVLSLYRIYIGEWLQLYEGDYQLFVKNLLVGDVEKFTDGLGSFILRAASYFDVAGAARSEQFYHGFMMALISSLDVTHIIRSNRESGSGRYDVLLIPRDKEKDLGIILEFKHAKSNESLEAAARNALNQINVNEYHVDVEQHSHIKKLLKIGLAFSGKSASSIYKTTDLANPNELSPEHTRNINIVPDLFVLDESEVKSDNENIEDNQALEMTNSNSGKGSKKVSAGVVKRKAQGPAVTNLADQKKEGKDEELVEEGEYTEVQKDKKLKTSAPSSNTQATTNLNNASYLSQFGLNAISSYPPTHQQPSTIIHRTRSFNKNKEEQQ